MADKSRRRTTEITTIDEETEVRRAFGAQELIRVMGDIKPHEGRSIHIMSGGNVDLICHVRWLLVHYKHIKRMFLSCWTISAPDIMLLKRWSDNGEIEDIDILVGDVFPARYKIEWAKLKELYNAGYFSNVYRSSTHSKLMLFEMQDGEKVVVESSANCNMNPRVEQSCVTVSDKLYNFYREYFYKLFAVEDAREARLLLRSKKE